MRAFIFPGQGSQKIGMGAELAEASAAAREVFGEVDEALSQKLFTLMSEGPEDVLLRTENAQPAIMANAIATQRVLERDFGISLIDHGDCVAGHSLGEYTALCAVGAFTLADTARLLKLRGQAMQAAVPVGEGAMAALLGATIAQANALAKDAANDAHDPGATSICEIANDNDPTQIVISGHRGAVERAVASVKNRGIKRGLLLPVSAPFHCSLMQPAADRMAEALDELSLAELALPLYANVTAGRVTDPEVERRLLVEQVTGRVRWRETIINMRADGVQSFVELGGKVLSPMIARIDRDATATSLITMKDMDQFAKEIA